MFQQPQLQIFNGALSHQQELLNLHFAGEQYVQQQNQQFHLHSQLGPHNVSLTPPSDAIVPSQHVMHNVSITPPPDMVSSNALEQTPLPPQAPIDLIEPLTEPSLFSSASSRTPPNCFAVQLTPKFELGAQMMMAAATHLPQNHPDFQGGKEIPNDFGGKYLVIAEIAQGNFGSVFKVQRLSDGKVCSA